MPISEQDLSMPFRPCGSYPSHPVHRTQDGQAEKAFIKGSRAKRWTVLFLYLINAGQDLLHRKVGLKVDFILCQAGHQAVRAFEAEKKVSLQLLLCGFQFSMS